MDKNWHSQINKSKSKFIQEVFMSNKVTKESRVPKPIQGILKLYFHSPWMFKKLILQRPFQRKQKKYQSSLENN